MPACLSCGANNPGNEAFCGACGAVLAAPVAPRRRGPLPAPDEIEWVSVAALLTDRFMLYEVGKMLFWTAALIVCGGSIVALLMGGADASLDEWLFPLGIFGGIMAGFAIFFLLIMLLFFGNRYPARIHVARQGVSWESVSMRAKWGRRAAIVAGVLTANPTVAGAGLLAESQREVSMTWDDIRRIRCHPRYCAISLMNGWRVVLRLHCYPTNYDDVCRVLRAHARNVRWEELGG